MTDGDAGNEPRVVRWRNGWLAAGSGETAMAPTRESASALLMLKVMRLRAAAVHQPAVAPRQPLPTPEPARISGS